MKVVSKKGLYRQEIKRLISEQYTPLCNSVFLCPFDGLLCSNQVRFCEAFSYEDGEIVPIWFCYRFKFEED
jgi:hypothetical protein